MKKKDTFLGYFNNVDVQPFGAMAKVILSNMRESDTGIYIAYISDGVLYICMNDQGEPLMPEMVISNYFLTCKV